ncbi:sugar phosphate isomerase/epimerase family protein [Alicyclobacillus mengziensis]|uniref:Sugar phosphate isomerase/epimerase n=1 Tax=Alicyclobacillus mengziensis TaxID=2931921 RepID=A0A9X7VZC6_9BACL|nr:sugar phosphate isomerase/epimerase [Alicyclobacillus mengziensis]QSO46493.1 sugar phosphate isomerase/epimerase [Alicyclobacillus mengziensis]
MPKLGLQLYSLRDLAKDDFLGTLKQVADIGYDGVEFAGYGGLSAQELRRVVGDLGLEPVSSHVQLSELESNLRQVIEYGQELGLSYVVCPYLPEDKRQTLDDYRRLADTMNQIGQEISQAGMTLAYHNHAFEFVRFENQYALDALYALTDKRYVQAELDIYWVEYAGQSALEYVERYADRSGLLHVKDMTKDDERFFAEVGTGRLDIPSILSTAKAGGIEWYLVEQDVIRRDPLESVTMSYRYLLDLTARQ